VVSAGPFELTINVADVNPELLAELKAVCEHHKGDSDVHIVVKTSEGPKKLKFGSDYRVRPSAGLRNDLDQILSAGALAA